MKFLGRKRIRLVALVVAVTAGLGVGGVATAYADNPADAARDQSDVQPNIIGGNSPTQDYPSGAKVSFQYDAANHDRFDWHTCGSFMPFGRYGVVPAHCVTNPPPDASAAELETYAHRYHTDLTSLAIPVEDKSFKVRVGNDDRTAGRLVKVKRIVAVHPLWKWELTGEPGEQAADIAMYELEEYVDDADLLPLAVRDPRVGDTVYRIGWGITDPDGQGPLPVTLRELKSQIKDKAECEPGDVYGWSVGDICVGDFPGYEDDGACSGDSGSPAMYKQDGRWVAAGSTSRGTGYLCGVVPESYTGMAFYKKWVYDTVRTASQIPEQRTAEPEPTHTQPYEPPTP